MFKGDAWLRERGDSWVNVGWARIVVRRDGVDPLFEGAFTIAHDHHHIQLRSYYASTKHELDPEIEDEEDEFMVLWRDSDIKRLSYQDRKRSASFESSCMAGELSFNLNPQHKIFAPPQDPVFRRSLGRWGAAPVPSLFGKGRLTPTAFPAEATQDQSI